MWTKCSVKFFSRSKISPVPGGNLAWEWRPRENCGDRRHPTKNCWKVPLSRHFVNIENITIVNFALVLCLVVMLHEMKNKALRWLDIVFQSQYLPSLSVNYVAINKDLEKLTPQLY